ncbi:hypothetical protein TNCV_3835131 [Trichonephila clavipes]|nr:hypothetical protein TNCV_3835131 [Trichonephila clavipes]
MVRFGHQSLPPINLDLVDEEMVSPDEPMMVNYASNPQNILPHDDETIESTKSLSIVEINDDNDANN